MSTTLDQTTECDILSRMIDSNGAELSPEFARAILRWELAPDDAQRLQELADRNNEGELSDAECRELEAYVRVGQFVAVLQAKARLSLGRCGEEA